MDVTINKQTKKAMNLKKSKEGYPGRAGGRKEKGVIIF